VRLVSIVAFLSALILTIAGASPGGSASNSQIEIVWQVPTNDWPDRLWIYKVVPQEFSLAVVSNLLAMADFTERDRAKAPDYLSEADPRSIFYGGLDGGVKHLAICPTLGYIEYHDPKAEASSQLQKVDGVPDETETTRLGVKWLRLLGIDVSQIATKPGTSDLDLHWEKGTMTYTDQATQKEVVLTNNLGILFDRRIDGVRVQGFGRGGGVRVLFGNHAQIVELQLCWRNLKHHELKNCSSLHEVEEAVRSGRLALHPLGTKALLPAEQVRKLAVTLATPFYEGKYQGEAMDLVRPYANFQGVADVGGNAAAV
jgi:hypothetical protein